MNENYRIDLVIVDFFFFFFLVGGFISLQFLHMTT